MSESVSRSLRDGAVDGELAPALTIADALPSPLGHHLLHHFLHSLATSVVSHKSQSHGLVLVALDRSPGFYLDFLKSRGIDVAGATKWLRIVDCFTDPLGWRYQLLGDDSHVRLLPDDVITVCRDVKDVNGLFDFVLGSGKGVAGQSKGRFCVAIDSVSTLLRHTSLLSISSFISNLRSHDQVSCTLWLVHTDLHEQKASSSLDYMSSMVATVEPIVQKEEDPVGGGENLAGLEKNSQRGKLNVRIKRRNGRVKVTAEEFHIYQTEVKFVPVSSRNLVINQTLLPKLQFNLQLSEKEILDRAKVELPFEHQDDEKTSRIYDGRQSLIEGQLDPHAVRPILNCRSFTGDHSGDGKGEIHYIRDSDDEHPDSDEDPDDDLDI